MFFDELKERYGKEFFAEETICDYLVTENMKKVWAVSLDLLEKFIEVCNKYNLKYYAIAGTLLGAVRHKGFIPWDDDIDIGMPRQDYERFLQVGPSEFKHPLFLQTPYTDSKYGYSFAKIRNSETSSLSTAFIERDENMNMGLFLDIFPLDAIRLDKLNEVRNDIYHLIMVNSATMKYNSVYKTEKDIKCIEDFYCHENSLIDTYDEIQSVARRYENDPESTMLAQATVTVYRPEKLAYPKECFDETVTMTFEGVEVCAPAGYDEILKILFGDYMQFPPAEQRGVWHQTIIYPDIPYKDGIQKWLEELKSVSEEV